MTEPRTAAGRRLVARLHNDYLYHLVDGRRDEHIAAILAIEAEASAEGLREAAKELSEALLPYEAYYWTPPEPVFALRKALRE